MNANGMLRGVTLDAAAPLQVPTWVAVLIGRRELDQEYARLQAEAKATEAIARADQAERAVAALQTEMVSLRSALPALQPPAPPGVGVAAGEAG